MQEEIRKTTKRTLKINKEKSKYSQMSNEEIVELQKYIQLKIEEVTKAHRIDTIKLGETISKNIPESQKKLELFKYGISIEKFQEETRILIDELILLEKEYFENRRNLETKE